MEINQYVIALIENAIAEDIGDGDHTSLASIPANVNGKVKLVSKAKGVIAGLKIAEYIFFRFDKNIKIEFLKSDGDEIYPGDLIFFAQGSVIDLLKAERLVLNILQRMSGIASQTQMYAKKLDGLKTKVLDTRKTTPGMRVLDKMAVKIGGGENHRMGLFDMILIKDNHIDFAGGIKNAILNTHNYLKKKNKKLKIEVEVRNFDDIKEVLSVGGIDRIMLDNFSIEDTKKAVKLIDGKFEIESSGGITLATLRDYAECGVDFISVGALTHQIKSLDLSLLATN